MSTVRGVFGFIALISGLICWTKIDTTLEPKLRKDFDFSPSIVALFYTIQFFGYLALSPFAHKILDKYDGTILTIISFYVIGLSCFLVGPSELMSSFIPNSIGVMIPGLIFTGFATVFTTIATYQEMQIPFIEKYGLDNIDQDKMGDVLAGLYNGAYSIGVIIGPFSASYIMIWLDNSFRR